MTRRLAQIRMRKSVKVAGNETLLQGLTYEVELEAELLRIQ